MSPRLRPPRSAQVNRLGPRLPGLASRDRFGGVGLAPHPVFLVFISFANHYGPGGGNWTRVAQFFGTSKFRPRRARIGRLRDVSTSPDGPAGCGWCPIVFPWRIGAPSRSTGNDGII